MVLRGLKFEYNVDTLKFDACRLILLEVKENQYFIGYHWKLEVTGDGINAVCRGSDNLPNDWGAFRNALNFLGIKDSRFPF